MPILLYGTVPPPYTLHVGKSAVPPMRRPAHAEAIVKAIARLLSS